MNLREIISITGKPGLYKILSQGTRMLLVEELSGKKRQPVGPREKVVSLGDIAMYTDSEDLPLGIILDRLYEKHGGEKIDVKGLIAAGGLRDAFAEVVADFDRDRVYDSDIKKLFTWYNILTEAGYSDFSEALRAAEEAEEAEAAEAE
ncbi:MAG: DUF5606 domain-containing protein [Muribaculaceae bacterium]|nr:DUF5606 domain-containing protein [Muribaculaceae bacterium]